MVFGVVAFWLVLCLHLLILWRVPVVVRVVVVVAMATWITWDTAGPRIGAELSTSLVQMFAHRACAVLDLPC